MDKNTLLCSSLQSPWFIPSISLLITYQIPVSRGGFCDEQVSQQTEIFPFCMTIMSRVYKSSGLAPVCSCLGFLCALGCYHSEEKSSLFDLAVTPGFPSDHMERGGDPQMCLSWGNCPPSTCRLLTLLQSHTVHSYCDSQTPDYLPWIQPPVPPLPTCKMTK